MDVTTFYNSWELWELYHKITVDVNTKIIFVNPDVTQLNIKADVYSSIKELWSLPGAYLYSRFDIPMRTVGGDAIPGTSDFVGDIYFMINGWRIAYDPRVVQIEGVLFSDDYDTPWVFIKDLQKVYPAKVSGIVQTVSTESIGGITVPTAQEIADAVWSKQVAALTDETTIGGKLANQVAGLTEAQSTMLLEIYKLYGLDPTAPLIVTDTSRTAGAGITQNITSDATTTTVTRV